MMKVQPVPVCWGRRMLLSAGSKFFLRCQGEVMAAVPFPAGRQCGFGADFGPFPAPHLLFAAGSHSLKLLFSLLWKY